MVNIRIGIDIGGAFTDLVSYDGNSNKMTWEKVETTPDDLARGVIECVKKSGLMETEVDQLIHGQTVVINTIIERKGVNVGLITTKGHRDVLELQRGNRRDMYNFRYKKPEPLIPRRRRLETNERTRADGTIIKETDSREVSKLAKKLVEQGSDIICIGFLNSYINPLNENRAMESLTDLKVPVVLSHEVTREWREYERFSTAVLNAYVHPILNQYLDNLQKSIKSSSSFMAMTSEGGMVSFDYAKKYPIYTIESGPVAGVMGALGIAKTLDIQNVITIDGGSTTTKAALLEELIPEVSTEYYVERNRFRPGLPVMVPVIRTVEIGNGGTSIVWIDELGRIKVGPRAAGAYPGPVCYNKGGTDPTLTDAYVVSGLLNPNHLLGGDMIIHKDLAEKAISGVASKLDINIYETAEGIINLANDQAAHAIVLVSVQRGYDPRDFTLIAYGGSGPMFAPFIINDLEIESFIVPAIPPGVFSAWGMLNTDIKHSKLLTNIIRLNTSRVSEKIKENYQTLEKEVEELFSDHDKKPILERYADIRYYGQEHTVRVPIPSGEIKDAELDTIKEIFHFHHEREYEFKLPNDPVEIVNFQVVGTISVPHLEQEKIQKRVTEKKVDYRNVFLEGDKHEVPVYERKGLGLDMEIIGPSIIEDPTSTILILGKQKTSLDKFGNVIVRRLKK
jgi:N-methylhydantoinase A